MQEGSSWTSALRAPELRVRATASLPAAGADRRITPDQVGKLAEELRYTDFALAVQELSGRRGASMPAVRWEAGRTGRSTDRCSFAYTVAAPDGEPALAAEVMLSMTSGSLVAVAELRVEEVAAWQAALQAGGALAVPDARMRLSLHELWVFLAAAWRAVTHDLPAVLYPDPTFGPFTMPPQWSCGCPPSRAPGRVNSTT